MCGCEASPYLVALWTSSSVDDQASCPAQHTITKESARPVCASLMRRLGSALNSQSPTRLNESDTPSSTVMAGASSYAFGEAASQPTQWTCNDLTPHSQPRAHCRHTWYAFEGSDTVQGGSAKMAARNRALASSRVRAVNGERGTGGAYRCASKATRLRDTVGLDR
jgi:hypothetical protein